MHYKIHTDDKKIFIMTSSLSLVSWMRQVWQYPKISINYYLREESKKECQEETTQDKADKQLSSFQRVNQSRRQGKNRLELKLTFTKLFCNKKETDSQVNMSLSMLKKLKSIIFNLSTKNIKIFT